VRRAETHGGLSVGCQLLPQTESIAKFCYSSPILSLMDIRYEVLHFRHTNTHTKSNRYICAPFFLCELLLLLASLCLSGCVLSVRIEQLSSHVRNSVEIIPVSLIYIYIFFF